jgi:hypothetical protein
MTRKPRMPMPRNPYPKKGVDSVGAVPRPGMHRPMPRPVPRPMPRPTARRAVR